MDPNNEPVNTQQPDEAADWSYVSEATDEQPQTTSLPPFRAVQWSASEFIQHDKSPLWFLGLAAVALVLTGLVYIISEDAVTSVVILAMCVLFGIMANRKPRTLNYQIDNKALTIGTKVYPIMSFRSFSLIDDGALSFIQLMPTSRISPLLKIYYPPEQEEEIINTLGSLLPHEQRERDGVDRLMSKIRF